MDVGLMMLFSSYGWDGMKDDQVYGLGLRHKIWFLRTRREARRASLRGIPAKAHEKA